MEDTGESKEHLVYGRQPHEFKHPYGFDHPLDNWAELVVATGTVAQQAFPYDTTGGAQQGDGATGVRIEYAEAVE